MRKHMLLNLFVAGFVLASPAGATFITSYPTMLICSETALFCGDEGDRFLVTLVVEHDRPIPESNDPMALLYEFEDLIELSVENLATFVPDNFLFFSGGDFTGTCVGPCEVAPPQFDFRAVDPDTGISVAASFGTFILSIRFPDRSIMFEDFFIGWNRGETVEVDAAVPATLGLVLGALPLLFLAARRRDTGDAALRRPRLVSSMATACGER